MCIRDSSSSKKDTWDSGLVGSDGKVRPAMGVLKKVLKEIAAAPIPAPGTTPAPPAEGKGKPGGKVPGDLAPSLKPVKPKSPAVAGRTAPAAPR